MTDNAESYSLVLASIIKNSPTGEEETEKFIELLPDLVMLVARMGQSQIGNLRVSHATYLAMSNWCKEASTSRVTFHIYGVTGPNGCTIHINWEMKGE